MKLIKAYMHHIRTAEVLQSLAEAGYRNVALLDVRGMLSPLSETERDYSREGAGLVIAEIQLELVCNDADVAAVTDIIRSAGQIGPQISGWVYVSPVDQALPVGGAEVPKP